MSLDPVLKKLFDQRPFSNAFNSPTGPGASFALSHSKPNMGFSSQWAKPKAVPGKPAQPAVAKVLKVSRAAWRARAKIPAKAAHAAARPATLIGGGSHATKQTLPPGSDPVEKLMILLHQLADRPEARKLLELGEEAIRFALWLAEQLGTGIVGLIGVLVDTTRGFLITMNDRLARAFQDIREGMQKIAKLPSNQDIQAVANLAWQIICAISAAIMIAFVVITAPV